MSEQRANRVNTVLLSVILAIIGPASLGGGWAMKEVYTELRSTHDAVLKSDIEVTALKARVLALEVDFQRFREKHP